MGGGADGLARLLIREYRAAAGLTQRQLASSAGVSVGLIRDLEQGRTASPHPESVRRLSQALSLDLRQAGELARAAGRGAGEQARPGPAGVRVCLLGPLTAWRGEDPVVLGTGMRRAVLGLLALSAGGALHRDAIVDALWGTSPAATAANQVQALISHLRKSLDPGRSPRDPGGLLVSAGTSYRLRLGAGQLDLLAFRDLVSRGSQLRRSDPAAAFGWYERALRLWRGAPLADVDELAGHPAVTGLAGEHAAAVLEFAGAAFAAGQHASALPQLRMLAVREPLHERVHAQLMIGLAGGGQQAAALEVYQALCRRLDEQLGVLPGPQLADAHLRVLRQEVPGSGPRRAG